MKLIFIRNYLLFKRKILLKHKINNVTITWTLIFYVPFELFLCFGATYCNDLSRLYLWHIFIFIHIFSADALNKAPSQISQNGKNQIWNETEILWCQLTVSQNPTWLSASPCLFTAKNRVRSSILSLVNVFHI